MAYEGDSVNNMRVDTWPEFPTGGDEVVTRVDPTHFILDFGSGKVWEPCMVGFILAHIVSVVHDGDMITGREMVSLIRDRTNWRNLNAIRVFSSRGVAVGFVERSVSEVLAPLLDADLIRIEGIVPNSLGVRDISGKKIPFQIHVFAKRENLDKVYVTMTDRELELIRTDKECAGIPEIVRQNTDDRKRLNDIFTVQSEGGLVEVMEAPKEVIRTELFMHQKEGLAWLVKRESSGELPPFWVEESEGIFYNEAMDDTMKHRPQPLRGGIFADDMGMGKTLTLLCLIALDKCGYADDSVVDGGSGSGNNSGSDVVDDDGKEFFVCGGKNQMKGSGTPEVNRVAKRQRVVKNLDNAGHECYSIDVNVVPSRTTLVVCPTAVFSTWSKQLKEHTKPGKLNFYPYYGERTNDPMVLAKYDLVLTTYSILRSERPSDSAVFRVAWWRVILDEAHTIKNNEAKQTCAVYKLNAKRRWLVTGTPIQNSTADLFSFMSFLRLQPFANDKYWRELVQRPVDNGEESGLTRIQALMATICLRRTKDNGLLRLPPKKMEICFVELSAEERELYDRMEVQAKTVVKDYISSNRVINNYTTVLSMILRLRQVCTAKDLCPKDLLASLPASNIEDVSNNPDLLMRMAAMLEDNEDFDCPICISPPTNIVITRCAHIYCRSCILKTLKRGKACCPLCRQDLSESDLFSPPREVNDNVGVVSSSKSSKIAVLLTLLSASRDQDPTAKSVVFSQFRKMLILLEEPLENAGFKILRLDGSMNAKKRAQVIKNFAVPAPDGPTILLASLKASGTGVNLTAANRVYLLEPWWNPAVEEQAMDRVHGIGQTKEVTIVRMIARNSIEERILELQDKKKRIASEALKWKRSRPRLGKQPQIDIDGIRTLMSL